MFAKKKKIKQNKRQETMYNVMNEQHTMIENTTESDLMNLNENKRR